jgi:hypothetical protein
MKITRKTWYTAVVGFLRTGCGCARRLYEITGFIRAVLRHMLSGK